jgi:hypothetical protein
MLLFKRRENPAGISVRCPVRSLTIVDETLMSAFRRENPHPLGSDAFDLVVRYAHEKGIHLSEEALSKPEALLGAWAELLTDAREPHRIHGRRTEEMFSYVVSALGAVRAIKREDAGELLVEEKVGKPDFRLVMRNGQEFFIEVKNCNHLRRASIPSKTLTKLKAYGELFARPVYVAVYWSQWRFWTLHNVDTLLRIWNDNGSNLRLQMADALKASEMYLLGDEVLGTTPPLVLRLSVDGPDSIPPDSGTDIEFAATVGGVELFCGGKLVTSEREKRIALDMMLYGQWEERGPLPVVQNERLQAVEFVCEPSEYSPDLGFAVLAPLSRLHSAHFNALTLDDEGKVRRLHPSGEIPPPPYPAPPEDYRGDAVPLWRLVVRPPSDVP